MTARFRLKPLILNAILAGILACGACALPAPALAVSDDPVLRRMDTVLEENARLREEAWKAHKNHDQEAARQATEALNASEERVERTRAEALAHVANVSPAQVEALRKDGKSWGQAAGELGVHPGFLGVGKVPLYEPQSVSKTQRVKSGNVVQAKGKRGKKKDVAQAADNDRKTVAKGKTGKAKGKEMARAAESKGKTSVAKAKGKAASVKSTAKTTTKSMAKDKPEKKARKGKKKAADS